MGQRPDLSICIVNWNGRQMLRNLLASIAATCDGLNCEVIVADNASADGSADMIASEFPEVKLIRNSQNFGFARGNNQAAAVATGRMLLFLNNDTVVLPGALRALAGFLDEHPDVAAVGPRLIGSDGKPQWTGRSLPTLRALLHQVMLLKWTGLFKTAYRRYRKGNFHPDQSGPVEQLAAAALLVRMEHNAGCGGWDEGFLFGVEDVDYCARLSRFGSIFYLAEASIHHLGRISSRANRSFVYRGYECGYARYLAKHHGRRASMIYKVLVTLDMPLRIGILGLQTIWAWVCVNPERARHHGQRLNAAAGFFFHSLLRFWRA